MALARVYPAGYVFLRADGQGPASAGTVTFYVNGTTTEATVYSDSTGSTASDNPLTLGADGRLPNDIYANAPLRVKLADSLGSQIFQKDNQTGTELLYLAAGGVGDGTTNDATALQAFFTAAEDRVGVFPEKKTFAIQSVLTIPAGAIIHGNGCTIRRTTSDSSSSFQINIGAGAQLHDLTLEVPTGVTINRGITLNGNGAKAYNVTVTSTDQQGNGINSNHAAFNVNGDDCYVENLKVVNFDYAIRFEDSDDLSADKIVVSSYMKGLEVQRCDRFDISGYRCSGKSANATTDPGHNGFLMSECLVGVLNGYQIADSGEHGLRMGGGAGSHGSANITFADGQILRAGQTGFKILDSTNRTSGILINGLKVYDCHYNNAAGSNEDGLRLMRCDDVTVLGFSVSARETSSACYDGIYMEDVTEININTPDIWDCANHGIHLNDAGEAVNFNRVYISSPRIRDCAGDGIQIDVATASSALRNVFITDAFIATVTGYGVELDTTDAIITQPVVITGKLLDCTAGRYNEVTSLADADLKARLEDVEDFETATGTFTASSYQPTTKINSSGGAVSVTLGDGPYIGFIKTFVVTSYTSAVTVTVTNHVTTDGEVGTFTGVDAYWSLVWMGTEWATLISDSVTGL